MKTKEVSEIIKNHINHYNSICDELNRIHDMDNNWACNRKIILKRDCVNSYDAISSMLRIACILGDCDIPEFRKLSAEIYEKYKGTVYGL